MSTPSTLGYLVINERLGEPCVLLKEDNALWKRVPSEGILLYDPKTATVFPHSEAARKAINRTKAYFIARAVRGEDTHERESEDYSLRRLLTP